MNEDAGRPASGGGGHIPPRGGEATNCAFTLDHYRELLDAARAGGYRFAHFDELPGRGVVLLRG